VSRGKVKPANKTYSSVRNDYQLHLDSGWVLGLGFRDLPGQSVSDAHCLYHSSMQQKTHIVFVRCLRCGGCCMFAANSFDGCLQALLLALVALLWSNMLRSQLKC